MRRVKTSVFPVGGLGTRFLPATKSMPKEMLPIANKPIIQYAYEEAKAAGIEKFIFVTGRNKNAINNHFDHAYELESKLDEKNKSQELNEVMGWLPQAGQVAFVRQQKPLGLGHSIWCARNFIAHDEAFIVILADEMMMQSRGSKKNFLGDMIEKPKLENAPSNLAITGRYILQPEIFEYLSKFEIGSGGEIQLTDAMKAMCKNFPYYYKKIDEVRFDCGNVLGYLEANIAFAINNDMVRDEVKKILKKYL